MRYPSHFYAIYVAFHMSGNYRLLQALAAAISLEMCKNCKTVVDSSDDEQEIVFGQLDNEPVVNSDMKLGQQLAVSYEKIREHRRF
jgi:hypothetical protein